jgi:hypothetical protein
MSHCLFCAWFVFHRFYYLKGAAWTKSRRGALKFLVLSFKFLVN